MHWLGVAIAFFAVQVTGLVLPPVKHQLPTHIVDRVHQRTGGVFLPIQRSVRGAKSIRRAVETGVIGLGDVTDLTYTVSVQLGNTTTAVNLDTGSSDLWVISSACATRICRNAKVPAYSLDPSSQFFTASSFFPTPPSVALQYGDSTSGTHAIGPVGTDTAVLAGLEMTDQWFAAVNDTDNTSVEAGAAGIFGLGFPAESVVQNAVVTAQTMDNTTDSFVSSIATNGPLLSRLAASGALAQPMFTITLQRDAIDIGASNHGQLTIGQLPDGIDNSSLTWVPVRLYSQADGGLQPPTFAPNEVYPLRWEVPLDAVYLDGSPLPSSNIASVTQQVSALIDTGNSILRGPADVVSSILTTVSPSFNPTNRRSQPTYPCSTPHTVSFQIGGQMFPVDPRDFLSPSGKRGDTTNCVAGNIVSTDPPSVGALFSWSLGDTFLKSNLVAFYYGNLTHPSVDPPRVGFLSSVPANASQLLVEAIQNAASAGGFPSKTEAAPSSTMAPSLVAASGGSSPPTASMATTTGVAGQNVTSPADKQTSDAHRVSSILSAGLEIVGKRGGTEVGLGLVLLVFAACNAGVVVWAI